MKRFLPRFTAALSLLAAFFACQVALAQTPAFPGAYGFGANATGGRGGSVYHVTNLNDSGAGSFRDAVSTGNRTVVFDVGGYIVINSPVSVASNITIAGQTAPGGGVGIMGGEVSFSGKTNVIVRNVRFRQGLLDPLTGKSAVNIGTGTNMIFDHCSFEYGQWDTFDAVKSVNFTVQNSILADPIGQQFGAHVETGPSTFYRNLWVNAHNRQPLSKDNTQYINNVIYDYQAGYTSGNTGGFFSHDIVNNYFIAGPATTSPGNAYFQMNSNQSVYAVGNYLDSNLDGTLNGTAYNTVGSSVVLSSPWSPTTTSIPTLSAQDAFPSVVSFAGAFPRDEVDSFVVKDVNSLGTSGQLYKDQSVTGIENQGYGVIASGTPFPNTSGDGIADYWAAANQLSTSDPSVGNSIYGNTGYTNLEVYLNSLVLPAPWLETDLGAPGLQGASSYNPFSAVWLLEAGGTNDAGTFDQGQFAYQSYTGNGSLIAQVTSVADTDPLARAGIAFRSSTAVDAAFASVFVTKSQGIVFAWRSSDGGSTNNLQIASVSAPVWLKLVRNGNAIGAYYSSDGTTWQSFAPAAVSLPNTALAGLMSSSNSNNSWGTSSFSNVNLTQVIGSTVTLQLSQPAITYPGSVNVVAQVQSSGNVRPSGQIKLWDGPTLLTNLSLQGDGKAYWYINPSLSAGSHPLIASYSGDANDSQGFSPAEVLAVSAAPVKLSAACWNASFPYGGDYNCTVNLGSAAGPPQGSIQYTMDSASFSLPLSNGNAQFAVHRPDVGQHSVSITYSAQGDFAASDTQSEAFAVTKAPTAIQLTPSSYYQSASSTFSLQASVASWSAGAPTDGSVVFYEDGVALGTVSMGAGGIAVFQSGAQTPGSHVFTAGYSGSANYASADSAPVTVRFY